MIRLFKDYYDKNGIRYKVLSFSNGRYACESYHDGKCIYLKASELFNSPPVRPVKVKFTDMVVKKEPEPIIEEPVNNIISEPMYEEPTYEEPVYEKKSETVQKTIPLKDNIEETANNDFYADF